MNIGQARREFGCYKHGKIQKVEGKRLAVRIEIERVVDSTIQYAFDDEIESGDRGNRVARNACRPTRREPVAHGRLRELRQQDRKKVFTPGDHADVGNIAFVARAAMREAVKRHSDTRSEEHTSELQSRENL